MEFCDECGSMMKTEGDRWVCGNCGHETVRDDAKEEAMVTTQGQEESEVVDMSEAGDEAMGPTTSARSPATVPTTKHAWPVVSAVSGGRARWSMRSKRTLVDYGATSALKAAAPARQSSKYPTRSRLLKAVRRRYDRTNLPR